MDKNACKRTLADGYIGMKAGTMLEHKLAVTQGSESRQQSRALSKARACLHVWKLVSNVRLIAFIQGVEDMWVELSLWTVVLCDLMGGALRRGSYVTNVETAPQRL